MHVVLVSLLFLAGARGPLFLPTLNCEFLRVNAHWSCLHILFWISCIFSELHGVINSVVSKFLLIPRSSDDGHLSRVIVDVAAVEEIVVSCRAVVMRSYMLFVCQLSTI